MTNAPSIRSRLARRFDPVELRAIKQLWVRHSIAEDARDIEGLIATLASDCVYEMVPTGQRWPGHDGARAFYTELFAAFPDNRFALSEIVVGPQGVFEVARAHRDESRAVGRDPGVRAAGEPRGPDPVPVGPGEPAVLAASASGSIAARSADRRAARAEPGIAAREILRDTRAKLYDLLAADSFHRRRAGRRPATTRRRTGRPGLIAEATFFFFF